MALATHPDQMAHEINPLARKRRHRRQNPASVFSRESGWTLARKDTTMRTLFLTTAAFAALVMIAPIGKAYAADDSWDVSDAIGAHGGAGVCDDPGINSNYNYEGCERQRAEATAEREKLEKAAEEARNERDRRAKLDACDKLPTTYGIIMCRWSV
jgi:hypothetical protein